MKLIKMILISMVVLATSISVYAQKKGEKVVVFNADLHCVSCKAKVEKNIPFEKGVKDLKVDMEKKTITVTFKEDKNSTERLQKAIEKLNIQVTGIDGNCCKKTEKKVSCCKEEKK